MWSMIETTDIFRGAFFLCNGGRLAGVDIQDNNRRLVTFIIEGEDIGRLNIDYRKGQALVNPVLLRESLNHLRDILFTRLRKQSPASLESYAVAKGRDNHDRERENRGDQERC